MSGGALASVVAVALVVGIVAKSGGQLVLGRLMPVSEFAGAQLISNLAGLMASVLVPLLLLVVVQLLRRQVRETSALS